MVPEAKIVVTIEILEKDPNDPKFTLGYEGFSLEDLPMEERLLVVENIGKKMTAIRDKLLENTAVPDYGCSPMTPLTEEQKAVARDIVRSFNRMLEDADRERH